MTFQDFQVSKFDATLLSPGSSFALPQLAVALAIAFVFLAQRQLRRRGSVRIAAILRAMMSRRILFNRSTYADAAYFLINSFAASGLIGWGLLSAGAISGAVQSLLHSGFGAGGPARAPDWVLRGGLTLAAYLGYEIAYYLDHCLMHKIPFLWEIHKTHHSAEVLTPLTVYRVHPVESLIFVDLVALIVGAAQGLFVYASGKSVDVYALDGTNVIMVAFLFALAQLQHSQFWIPLTGPLGRIFLSPAHHQIHHSMNPAHYNRNFGSFLAILDWLFGTLHVPEKNPPKLAFGVKQTSANPHRLDTLLIRPLIDAFATLGFAGVFARLGGRIGTVRANTLFRSARQRAVSD